MKKLLLCFLCIFYLGNSYAQKLSINKVDKFSKEVQQETTLETLFSTNLLGTGFVYRFEFSLRKTGDKWNMPANILLKDVEKYDDDSGIILLLSNDETIILKTLYTGIGIKEFGNGHLFETCFSLSDEDISKLSKNDIKAIRIMYLGGSYDKELKGKKQGLVRSMLNLFN